MKIKKKRILNLYLFDGEAGGGGEGAGAVQGIATPKAEGTKVIYGKAKTEGSTGSAAGSDGSQTEDKSKKYLELIKGEYKEEHERLLKEQIDRRFKNQPKVDPKEKSIINSLKMVYDTDDVNAILESIEKDNRLLAEKADSAGMTVEQYRKQMKLERENAELKEAERLRTQAEQEDAAAQEIYSKWMQEADELKQEFPDFDLEAESDNKDFRDLLESGVPLSKAYKLIHLDDIMAGTAQTVATQVRKNTIETVKARGIRPIENGITEQPGTVRKDDVSKLTKQDREQIAKLAIRGVDITL